MKQFSITAAKILLILLVPPILWMLFAFIPDNYDLIIHGALGIDLVKYVSPNSMILIILAIVIQLAIVTLATVLTAAIIVQYGIIPILVAINLSKYFFIEREQSKPYER